MDVINEGTTGYLTVTFLDKDGVAVAPASVSYRIDCLTTGTAVVGATSVTPGTSVEIQLTAANNAILGNLPRERRRVTVTGTYSGSQAVTHQYDYEVRNLSAVT